MSTSVGIYSNVFNNFSLKSISLEPEWVYGGWRGISIDSGLSWRYTESSFSPSLSTIAVRRRPIYVNTDLRRVHLAEYVVFMLADENPKGYVMAFHSFVPFELVISSTNMNSLSNWKPVKPSFAFWTRIPRADFKGYIHSWEMRRFCWDEVTWDMVVYSFGWFLVTRAIRKWNVAHWR